MSYIDGYVLAVPTEKKEQYKAHSEATWPIFKAYGALKLVECWGDDVPEGKLTSFPMAVKKRDDETVVFSWIIWPSKEARFAGMTKVMEDPRFDPAKTPMPFDTKRMIFGGFDVMVDF